MRTASAVPATSPVPWLPSDLTRLLVCNAVGLFVVLTAWLGAGGTSRLSEQFNWMSLGVLGFLLAAVGNGAWVLSGRRAVGARLADILDGDPRTRPAVAVDAPAVRAASARPVVAVYAAGSLVAVPGTVRYHLAGCALVGGKDLEQRDLGSHEDAGRRPCELCRPKEAVSA